MKGVMWDSQEEPPLSGESLRDISLPGVLEEQHGSQCG